MANNKTFHFQNLCSWLRYHFSAKRAFQCGFFLAKHSLLVFFFMIIVLWWMDLLLRLKRWLVPLIQATPPSQRSVFLLDKSKKCRKSEQCVRDWKFRCWALMSLSRSNELIARLLLCRAVSSWYDTERFIVALGFVCEWWTTRWFCVLFVQLSSVSCLSGAETTT